MTGGSRNAMWAVIAHYVVNSAHGMAHGELAIPLSRWQESFIAIVILAAPAVAWLLIWRGSPRAGGALLALSTAGALLFGAWYHFFAISPDHVSHLPAAAPEEWKTLFRVTAVLLLPTEAFACGAGAGLFRAKPAA